MVLRTYKTKDTPIPPLHESDSFQDSRASLSRVHRIHNLSYPVTPLKRSNRYETAPPTLVELERVTLSRGGISSTPLTFGPIAISSGEPLAIRKIPIFGSYPFLQYQFSFTSAEQKNGIHLLKDQLIPAFCWVKQRSKIASALS